MLFALGIYSGIQFVFKLVYNSRVRIVETAMLNEQIESIRNMSFYDVGILSGSPAGLLERVVTTTRNGISFEITRTIRNIDDPFDGLVDGDPQDLSPADYKLVDVSVVCLSCQQQIPVSMSTYIAPKYLEGDPTHGALFIQVFDASAVAVPGALVTIISTSTNPTYNFSDTTDADGMLRVVDLAAGVEAFDIAITKNEYTSDQTLLATGGNPNPTKPFGTVLAQSVSEMSFSIDRIASMSVETLNESCEVIPSVSLALTGTKLIGTLPDVFLVDTTFSTNENGSYNMADVVWDTYTFDVTGYDIVGSIPKETVQIVPGASQPVQLILGTAGAHALRVDVVNSVTGQPISNATVTVTSTLFNGTYVTGVGSRYQTDWSLGSGQDSIGNDARYFFDDGNVDVLTTPGDIMLRNTAGEYESSGWLESSTFDLGLSATYQNIIWEPLSQSPETGSDSVTFHIATASSSSPISWDFLGPDGTSGTYYTNINGVIAGVHDGDRYMRYRTYLSTASTTYTPTISNISFTYTNSCTPPGQVYVGDLLTGEYGVLVSASGYATSSASVEVDGYTKVTVVLQES